MPEGTEIARRPVCDSCQAETERERAQLQAQFLRLRVRGYSGREANVIMSRRVDRYFRNGTFVALKKRAVA